jgi:6-pyruvoyltetrahydropterin/6-carboxytetrahydropterin synthase
VRRLANELVAEPWDHAFIVYQGDQKVRDFLEAFPDHKTVVVPFVPTAENLARRAFEILKPAFDAAVCEGALWSVTFYETPNSWATYPGRAHND